MKPESHKGWEGNSAANINKGKEHATKVQAALQQLLAKEDAENKARQAEVLRLERVAEQARQEELKRQRAAAVAAEKQRKKEEAAAEQKKKEEQRAAEKAAYEAAVAQVKEEKRVMAESTHMEAQHVAMRGASTILGKAVLEMQYQSRTKYGQLKSVETRLEMRERRPEQELFEDHVHEALVFEKKTLVDSRAQLDALTKEADKALAELRAVQLRLSKGGARREVNLMKKSLSQSGSLPTLAMTVPSAPTSPTGNISLPPISPSSANGGLEPLSPPMSPNSMSATVYPPLSPAMARLTMSPEEKALSGVSTTDLLKLSHTRVQICLQLATKADELVDKTTKACNEAAKKVAASFEKRRKENEELREKLRLQAEEVDHTIIAAEEQIGRLRRSQYVPPSALEGDRSKPFEPSQAELKAAEEKWAQLEVAEAAVVELKAVKKQLEEDMRAKVSAMQIDNSCTILRRTAVDPRDPEVKNAHRMPKVSAMERSASVPCSPSQTQEGFRQTGPL